MGLQVVKQGSGMGQDVATPYAQFYQLGTGKDSCICSWVPRRPETEQMVGADWQVDKVQTGGYR